MTYEDLVAARAPALLRLAIMLTGNPADAEDLLQATLARTVRHGDRIAKLAAPAAYLRTVLVNEHVSTIRRLNRRVRTFPLEGHDVVAAEVAPIADDRGEMWKLLATLPRRQRAVLALRFYEDLPDAEIAVVLGCAEGTVRSSASRALATLRARLTTTEEIYHGDADR
jgi:RNA polymerase sigma-70 factor (sigma-E family)